VIAAVAVVAAACVGCGGAATRPSSSTAGTRRPDPTRGPTATTAAGAGTTIVSGAVWRLSVRGGASGVSGVVIDLLTAGGVRSVSTDAGGHYSIPAPSGAALTIEIPVLQDSLAHDRPVAPNTPPGGHDRSLRRSLGVLTADLDEIALPALTPGQRLGARDFGFVAAARG
jgi:hypothetical protein